MDFYVIIYCIFQELLFEKDFFFPLETWVPIKLLFY